MESNLLFLWCRKTVINSALDGLGKTFWWSWQFIWDLKNGLCITLGCRRKEHSIERNSTLKCVETWKPLCIRILMQTGMGRVHVLRQEKKQNMKLKEDTRAELFSKWDNWLFIIELFCLSFIFHFLHKLWRVSLQRRSDW